MLSVKPTLSHMLDDVSNMVHLNEDSTLDQDITIQEIQCTIRKREVSWSKVWLLFVFNQILQCESILKPFKQGITTSVSDGLSGGSYL